MSYGIYESTGENAKGLDQDKRKIGGRGQSNKQTTKQNRCRPTLPPPPKGVLTAHESNPPTQTGKKAQKHTPEIELSLVIGEN